MMTKLKSSFKGFLAIVFLLNVAFPFSSQASTVSKSQIYREALQVYFDSRNDEKVFEIVRQDEFEKVTSRLKSLNIDLGEDPDGYNKDIRDSILKVLAEEYIEARKTEIQDLALQLQKSGQSKAEVKNKVYKMLRELQADVEYFTQFTGSHALVSSFKTIALSILIGLAGLGLYFFGIAIAGLAGMAMILVSVVSMVGGVLNLLQGAISLYNPQGSKILSEISEKAASDFEKLRDDYRNLIWKLNQKDINSKGQILP